MLYWRSKNSDEAEMIDEIGQLSFIQCDFVAVLGWKALSDTSPILRVKSAVVLGLSEIG